MIAQGLIDTNNKTYKKYIENYKKYKDKIKKILKKYQGKTVDELILILDKGE
jgi:ABC-type Zn uptake system ZnuABC Zn-binding protein ZnuA